MPVIIGAKRKLRADARKEIVNNKIKDKLKRALKAFKAKPSDQTLKGAYSALDSASKKNVMPKQRGDRKKSRLAAQLAKTQTAKPKPASKSKDTKKI